MTQLLNTMGLLLLGAAAGLLLWRRAHIALLAAAVLIDTAIVILLESQRAVVAQAPRAMGHSPVAILHIATAILAFIGMWLCLVLAIRAWRRGEQLGVVYLAIIAATVLLRMTADGSSWLMRL